MSGVRNCTMKTILFSLIAVCFLFGAMNLPAEAAQYNWKMGMPWPVPVQDQFHKQFIELVKEYSKGKIEITYYPDGQLGTHDEIFHSVQDGSVDIGYFAPYVNLVPGGVLNWMPWTVMSWEAAQKAFDRKDGILWEMMEKAYNEVGMTMFYQVSYGPYGLGNNERPLKSPADLKNLKLRVSSSLGLVRMLQNMGKGSGMTLETIPWSDLYDALGKGVVDGCWSMWPSLVELRHSEVLKYYSDLNFAWDMNNVVINKKTWDALPKDLQDAVVKATVETQAKLFANQEKVQKDFIAKLQKMEGFEITFLTDAQREAFRKASNMGPIWEELCKPWLDKNYPGQNMTEKVQKELEKIHQEVLASKK
ncbi:MAG: TRAP transporter substrate-binding protein [Thermovirgaceae bacterium]|nr:TRAP transporter substrate-binding protein [Thermovirgaceae bacterium]